MTAIGYKVSTVSLSHLKKNNAPFRHLTFTLNIYLYFNPYHRLHKHPQMSPPPLIGPPKECL